MTGASAEVNVNEMDVEEKIVCVDISNLSREVVTWQLGLINALVEAREKSAKQAQAKLFLQVSSSRN